MADNNSKSKRIWEKGRDGHEDAQAKRMSGLSFREKYPGLKKLQNAKKKKMNTGKSD